jgi:hypothetical protein
MEATGDESSSTDRGAEFDREVIAECITKTSGASEARPDSKRARIRERIVLFSEVL